MATPLLTPSTHPVADFAAIPDDVMGGEPERICCRVSVPWHGRPRRRCGRGPVSAILLRESEP